MVKICIAPMKSLILLLALALSLQAEDKPTIEQLQAQITQLQQDLDQRTKLLNAYQQQFFACTAQAINEKALTPQRPAHPPAKPSTQGESK